nr:zinc-finger domain-containing protein [Ruegeria arenilitoris]
MPARPTTEEGSQAVTIEAPETKIVETARVACDGGEGALGHPRVWLQIPEDSGWVECPYCDCKYALKGAEQG